MGILLLIVMCDIKGISGCVLGFLSGLGYQGNYWNFILLMNHLVIICSILLNILNIIIKIALIFW